MNKHVALIAGITGAVGSALARELSSRDEWIVFGLSRNPPSVPIDRCCDQLPHHYLNLQDVTPERQNIAKKVRIAIQDLRDLRPLFYLAPSLEIMLV